MVAILLGTGFEEAEALVPADLLRRAGADVALVGVPGPAVAGGHNISVNCDCVLEQVKAEDLEMIVIPGGMGGVECISASDAAMELIRKVAAAGGYVAAICAAPSIVLGPLGILDGRKAVCYPGMEEGMKGAEAQKEQSVVTDGRVITGEGPGAAFDFGLKLVEALKGAETANQVAHDACWRH